MPRRARHSRTQLCKYRAPDESGQAIPGGPPGQIHANYRDSQPDGLRRVTQTPTTGVPLGVIATSKIH
jgi:hypothetical protein